MKTIQLTDEQITLCIQGLISLKVDEIENSEYIGNSPNKEFLSKIQEIQTNLKLALERKTNEL